jgi:hypothetical protein
MYEHPSIRMELARQRHQEWIAEARNARLAAEAEQPPSETLALVKRAATAVGGLFSRRPAPALRARLQPTV